MKIHEGWQGTPQWYELRLGKPTASQFHKIITPGGKPSAQAHGYMHRLIAERLLNESMDDPTTTEIMELGRANQPLAAAQFAFANDVELQQDIGFCTDDDNQVGFSPDALIIGKPELVEIKCPLPHTHIGYMLDGPGNDHKPQVQGQLLISGYDRAHFYSWHPRMPPVHIVTERDDKYLERLVQLLNLFLDELEQQTEEARSAGVYVPVRRFITPTGKQEPGPVQAAG